MKHSIEQVTGKGELADLDEGEEYLGSSVLVGSNAGGQGEVEHGGGVAGAAEAEVG